MKINTAILSVTIGITLMTGLMTCSHYRAKSLQNQYQNMGVLSPDLSYHDTGLSLTGQSLILYHVTHPRYPNLNVRRIQIMNKPHSFAMRLQDVTGSLIRYLQDTNPYAFKRSISDYSPHADLLKYPFMSMVVLGYDDINLDLFLSAKYVAPNQISCHLMFKDKGQLKAHFTTKIMPNRPNMPIWEMLKTQAIPFRLVYLAPDLKQRLDDYILSKKIPFVTEEQQLLFQFLQK